MKLSFALQRRVQWLKLPTLSLIALLQRTPLVRIAATGGELAISSPVGAVLRSVATVAALGALHSRAGATTLTSNIDSPLQATVGKSIGSVAFGLEGTQTNPSSWQINGSLPPGLNINGRTSLGLFITSNPVLSGTPTSPGSFTLTLSGSDQGFVSPSFDYTINVTAAGGGSTAPAISTQPLGQTVASGANVTFTVAASGTPSPTFQWQQNGVAISGATSSTLTLTGVTTASAGTYTVVVTNSAGSATSNGAVLTVSPPLGAAPVITVQPVSQTVAPGGSVTFTVTATGTSPTYQWQKNGVAVGGATTNTLALTNLQASDAAYYTVVVTTAGGTTTSRYAQLVVDTPSLGRIANLSVRAPAGLGGQPLIVGFIVSGGSKQLLVRASGPALAAFGVSGTLPDPVLQVHETINNTDTVVASNDNWSSDPNAAAIAAVPGPFPFTPGSKDSALLLNVDSSRTALVSDANNGSGVALVEVYDVGTGNSPRLVNVSTRNFAGTGASVLIAGFIINGNVPKTLLIRGVGPTLAGFGVGGTLVDPFLEIHTTINGQDTVVASNDNWGDDANAAAAAAVPGPFALNAGSKDSALLITLPAGSYTAQVSGVNQTTGVALIEIYEVQ